MKAIILAAGQGTRLRPYTNDRPKCMVELAGRPILHRQIEVLRSMGIQDITLVGGYKSDRLDIEGVQLVKNPAYDRTNMVVTLFCASEVMRADEDLLISYGDIVFEPRVLKSMIDTDGEVVLAADRQWERLWRIRMDDPLSDAETFKLNGGRVVELGKLPKGYDDVHAQYMGLIKVRGDRVEMFRDAYMNMDQCLNYDGKDFDNMYMTSFIQYLIDVGWEVNAALVENGWLEIDTAEELRRYEALNYAQELDLICKL